MKVTAEDISQLLASSPPRQVPAHVRRAAKGGRGGWALAIFGLVFGGFGTIFVWMFVPWQAVADWRLDRSPDTVSGRVLNVAETHMSINDTKVIEYTFSYTTNYGLKSVGTCYTTGQSWQPGAEVTVRYLADKPEVARIEGSRLSRGSGFSAFVLIFPLVGYGLVVGFFLNRRRIDRLLHTGTVAEVDVRSVDTTGSTVNYQMVYKITLGGLFEAEGKPLTVKRWATPEVNLLTQRALQKQPIFVLYDPRQPKRLIFPEALIEP